MARGLGSATAGAARGGCALRPGGDNGGLGVLRERERELARLDVLIAEACGGSGRLLVVEASAGMGKTRLLEAARDAAPARMRVMSARGTELERSFPYALVRQLFEPSLAAMTGAERERLFDGAAATARAALGPAAGGRPGALRPEDRFGVLHGLYWLTAAFAEGGPLLLLADDVHWADDSSLDFFAFLMPRLRELPVLLAVACRPNEPGAARGVLPLVTDAAAEHLSPQPLSRDATRLLLSAELGGEPDDGFVAACHEVSGGNPFLLSELVRALALRSIVPGAAHVDVVRALAPDRVARSVVARLSRLSADARTVARSLAVLGDDSEHGLVAALGGLEPTAALRAADELRAAAILDANESLRFVHPLVRNALYTDIPGGERTVAHLSAAALLKERGAAAERLAGHLVVSDAHGSRETAETLLDAGVRALARGAPQSTIAYLRRALREPVPADLRAPVLQGLMMAGIRAADYSMHDAIEAEIRAELERDPRLLSRWALPLAVWLALGGRIPEAVPLLERAIDLARRERRFSRAFRLEAQLCSFARLAPAEIRARLAPYRDGTKTDGPEERVAAAFDAAWSLVHGDAEEGVASARRALHEGRIFREQPELLAAGWAMIALWSAAAADDARVAAEEALDVARERGAAPEIAAAWLLRGNTAIVEGNLAAAEADHRQALHVARLGDIRAAIPVLAGALAGVLVDRGALREAAAELDQVGEADHPVVWFLGPGWFRGRLLLAQGKLQEAAEQLLAVQRRLEDWGLDGMPFMQPRVLAARAFAGLGDQTRARELAEAEVVHARRWGAPLVIARVQRALALATEGPEGIELLREAVAMLETSTTRLDRAATLCELGVALRRAKRRVEAREPLREALELARECGAVGLAKYAHDELEATGERVRRRVSSGLESLTASERRVAEMAAEGMSNREIAQTLFLTVKTIESHLSAVYDKLGIPSRQLLPGALAATRPHRV
jgi:DNA-binding CsgD family transcriptional regulator